MTAQAPDTRERSATRRSVGLVLGAALLSAILASGGTYALVALGRPAAGAPGATAAPAATVAGAVAASSSGTTTITADDVAARVAASAEPSVVTITVAGASRSPFGDVTQGTGSGFVVGQGGLILTNNHVVADATSLSVTLPDGKIVDATIVATDPAHDLALVRAGGVTLPPLVLGDGSRLTVGQIAIAIGSPLGTFTQTVTQGIVSGLGRSIDVSDGPRTAARHLDGLIQTDAAINPGNSGGPLLDSAGHVIGIVTATASNSQGVGFAVPINVAKDLLAQAGNS